MDTVPYRPALLADTVVVRGARRRPVDSAGAVREARTAPALAVFTETRHVYRKVGVA